MNRTFSLSDRSRSLSRRMRSRTRRPSADSPLRLTSPSMDRPVILSTEKYPGGCSRRECPRGSSGTRPPSGRRRAHRAVRPHLRAVFRDEDARVHAQRVRPAVVAVLNDLVNEEQREHLDAQGGKARRSLSRWARITSRILDAPLDLIGHVRGDLPQGDNGTRAELDNVTAGVDVR